MTNTNLDGQMVLSLLRTLRAPQSPMYTHSMALVDELVERGLLIKHGGSVTTSSEANRLLDRIDEIGAQMVAEFDPCPYDHSHTSEWCGRDYCRSS